MQKTIFLLLITFWTSLFSDVIDLSKYEKKVFSQNGEDGIIEKFIELFGDDSRYCVEFGAFDGFAMSNSLLLRKEKGWQALLMDNDFENLEIGLHREFITPVNINQLFEKYQVPKNLDLISIDIDYNDFHVWNSISDEYRPRFVVIEYNVTFPPPEDKVVHYVPEICGTGCVYFGASMQAYYMLGRKKGYSLVYAEKSGVNLFFVRDDLIKSLESKGFTIKGINNPSYFYKNLKRRLKFKPDPLGRAFITARNLLRSEGH